MKQLPKSRQLLKQLSFAPMTRADAVKITGSSLTIKRMRKCGVIVAYSDINPHSEVKGGHSIIQWVRLGKSQYPDHGCRGKKVTEKGINARIDFLVRHGYTVTKQEK